MLDHLVHAALSAGKLPAHQFLSGAGVSAALDGNDFLIHDSTTRALYYDADGTGATAAVPFASLAAGLALSSLDFVVT